MVAGRGVVSVQIAEGESAAVEEHGYGMCGFPGAIVGPVDPDRDLTGGPVDAEVFDSEVGMHWPAGQFA